MCLFWNLFNVSDPAIPRADCFDRLRDATVTWPSYLLDITQNVVNEHLQPHPYFDSLTLCLPNSLGLGKPTVEFVRTGARVNIAGDRMLGNRSTKCLWRGIVSATI